MYNSSISKKLNPVGFPIVVKIRWNPLKSLLARRRKTSNDIL